MASLASRARGAQQQQQCGSSSSRSIVSVRPSAARRLTVRASSSSEVCVCGARVQRGLESSFDSLRVPHTPIIMHTTQRRSAPPATCAARAAPTCRRRRRGASPWRRRRLRAARGPTAPIVCTRTIPALYNSTHNPASHRARPQTPTTTHRAHTTTTQPPTKNSCDGEGRELGGLGALPGFGWWPIKAYRPCPALSQAGLEYTRCVPCAVCDALC
jgi:hypothetical protein